jgi:hypothetical protein
VTPPVPRTRPDAARPALVAGPTVGGEQYGSAMMGMGGLGPDGRRRQRLVAGLVVAAMLLTVGAVLIGSVL